MVSVKVKEEQINDKCLNFNSKKVRRVQFIP